MLKIRLNEDLGLLGLNIQYIADCNHIIIAGTICSIPSKKKNSNSKNTTNRLHVGNARKVYLKRLAATYLQFLVWSVAYRVRIIARWAPRKFSMYEDGNSGIHDFLVGSFPSLPSQFTFSGTCGSQSLSTLKYKSRRGRSN